MDFGDVQQPGYTLHNFSHALIAYAVFSLHRAVFSRHQLYRLRQRFVPLGQFFQPFINRHFGFLLPDGFGLWIP
jgi:hypothetical protein